MSTAVAVASAGVLPTAFALLAREQSGTPYEKAWSLYADTASSVWTDLADTVNSVASLIP